MTRFDLPLRSPSQAILPRWSPKGSVTTRSLICPLRYFKRSLTTCSYLRLQAVEAAILADKSERLPSGRDLISTSQGEKRKPPESAPSISLFCTAIIIDIRVQILHTSILPRNHAQTWTNFCLHLRDLRFMGSMLQPAHLIILLAILFFLFGGKWFSELGKGFASAVRNFRQSKKSSNPTSSDAQR
jgi:mttA/Hcf106 family